MMTPEYRNTIIPSHIVEIWQQVVDTISNLISVPSVMINRLSPSELEVFRSNNSPDNPFPAGTKMQSAGLYCEAAVKKRQKVLVQDARKDPVWADSPTAKAGIFAYMGYPVLWPDGSIFGTICAVDTKENKWGTIYESLFDTFRAAIEAHLALVDTLEHLEKKNQKLELALSEVKTLQGLIPICASCKKIRDDKGYWNQIESYIQKHSKAVFSHSICPQCTQNLYPDLQLHETE